MRKGLSSLKPGDTLTVRGGTYDEVLGDSSPVKITPGTAGAPILVQAYAKERPVIRGLLWLESPSYWTFNRINVTWKDGISSRKHMVKITNGVGWTFKNGDVWGAKSYANILVAGTKNNEPSNWRIANNRLHDVYKSNDTNQDHAIYCHAGVYSGSGVIEHNLIYNVANGNGVKVAGADPGQGSRNVTVRYNTIVNCTQGVLVGWETNNTKIYRNLIVGTASSYGAIRGFELTGDNNVAYDNVYWDCAGGGILNYNAGNGITDGGGNLKLDPNFKDSKFFQPLTLGAQAYGKWATTIRP
jgi:hypothetical protein